jgi:hypothetical protein
MLCSVGLTATRIRLDRTWLFAAENTSRVGITDNGALVRARSLPCASSLRPLTAPVAPRGALCKHHWWAGRVTDCYTKPPIRSSCRCWQRLHLIRCSHHQAERQAQHAWCQYPSDDCYCFHRTSPCWLTTRIDCNTEPIGPDLAFCRCEHFQGWAHRYRCRCLGPSQFLALCW